MSAVPEPRRLRRTGRRARSRPRRCSRCGRRGTAIARHLARREAVGAQRGEVHLREPLEELRGARPLERELRPVVRLVRHVGAARVAGEPLEVLRAVAGVDADEQVVGGAPVDDHVVDDAAVLAAQAAVLRLAVGDLGEVVREDAGSSASSAFGPRNTTSPMCETSKRPTRVRTASCSGEDARRTAPASPSRRTRPCGRRRGRAFRRGAFAGPWGARAGEAPADSSTRGPGTRGRAHRRQGARRRGDRRRTRGQRAASRSASVDGVHEQHGARHRADAARDRA